MKATLALCAGLMALVAATARADSPWPALPRQAPEPASNPGTPARVELGRMLFFDRRLSESATVSCQTCHDLKNGGADSQRTSRGVHGQNDLRNAQTVWNVGFLTSYFWDGRAATLEDQAKEHLLNPVDMGMKDLDYVAARIRGIAGYRAYFEKAFGAGDVVTADNIAKALAAFERTLITPDTPYDRYASGDRNAMNDQQLRGMKAFQEIGCVRCHQGPTFVGPSMSTEMSFVIRFPTNPRNPLAESYELTRDRGRFENTGKDSDRSLWRVASLRNLRYTAPYMHNGSVPNLADAVRVMASTELARTLSDTEAAELVAFIDALSGPLPDIAEPKLPE